MNDDEMYPDREKLLAAWESQFPTDGDSPRRGQRARTVVDPDRGWQRPESNLSETVNLSRGELAAERYQQAHQWLHEVTTFGGDHYGALTEFNAASEELLELQRTGATQEVVDLTRSETRTVHFPLVSSNWHPVA